MTDWQISPGPNRPIWEPVKLADFAGERFRALEALYTRLLDTPLESLADEDLAMRAILAFLFRDTTVRIDHAKAEVMRLATQRLPDPGARRRKRLSKAKRDDILIAVGRAWAIFTSHNFPFNPEA